MSSDMVATGSLPFRLTKRMFDIIFSLILMIPVMLVIFISFIVIKIEDRGPIFYKAERTGLFGKPFKMYKLRSMKENAPDIRLEDGSTYNGDDDPRVTKYGKFIRKTSIDELPQIINVLLGDMSFIGPRPDTPMYLDKYTEEEKIILTVRPGITGYNQAINRNSVLTKEKLKNDIYYVEHLSLLFDIKIIFLTILALLKRNNVNRNLDIIED
ncbi:sugar transferase [Anaerococcus sp. Marseille-P3915]|uniref:sugar transferase n=1 Tax=Anaerococcus sp. Marseille-P3915 TaxID=2057799 RepID=UPI0018F89D67|nr:sugar transferase [Anaerococcus sp. Marseille-P3915]